ncbi:MAG: hypothetical protein Fues2KO_49290 [Fuerstiella sp.]
MTGGELVYGCVLIGLAIIGACIGRFLNHCIDVFPKHERLRDQLRYLKDVDKSCARCGHRPTGTSKLPIVGWLLSAGRCGQCRSRLSWQPPFVELVTAVLFVMVYWLEVPPSLVPQDSVLWSGTRVVGPQQIDLFAAGVWLHARYLLHMVMICGLIVATAIDARLRIIPDGCNVPIFFVAVVVSGLMAQTFILPIWFQDASSVRNIFLPLVPPDWRPWLGPWDPTDFIQQSPRLHGLLVSIVGAIVGAGSVWVIRVVGTWALKQEAMGFGDVVLMGMIGSVIGWQPVLIVFLLAPGLAMIIAVVNWLMHHDNEIPYGPFLSFATLLVLLAWPLIWPVAKPMFDMGPFFILTLAFMTMALAVTLQLVQMVKRLFGFQVGPVEENLWTSGDHLHYYGQERPDEQTGQWPVDQWEGSRSGRGLKQYHDWKSGR